MPHLSKRKLDYRVEQELINSLEYVLSHSSANEIKIILSSLLSRTEKLMIAKRLGVALMLKEGVSNTAIDHVLKVTMFTVSKIELLFSTKADGFSLALKKLEQRKIEQGLKKLLLDLAVYASSAAFGHLPRKKNEPPF